MGNTSLVEETAAMSNHNVTVVEYPEMHLIGMKVRTTMQKAQQDCPALWQAFGPRCAEILPAGSDCTGAYGISVMLTPEEFEYWAAIEANASVAVPQGMGRVDIPAGQYAKCAVPNLGKLGEIYMYLYEEWPKSQKTYTYDEKIPCFELYPQNWKPSDALTVFMPVKKV